MKVEELEVTLALFDVLENRDAAGCPGRFLEGLEGVVRPSKL